MQIAVRARLWYLSFLAFEPPHLACTEATRRGRPCSLSSLTADAITAISSTGSYLRDLGGANLLTTSWRDGRFGTRQFAAEPQLTSGALMLYVASIQNGDWALSNALSVSR